MQLYSLAIGMTILANVGYHLCQKAIRPDVSAGASLLATYAVALVVSLVLWPWLGGGEGLVPAMRRLGPATYALGGCVVLLELGFLLAYRAGWTLGVAALYSNAAVALVLLPIGLVAFGEGLDLRKGLGLLLAFAGLMLLSGSRPDPAAPEQAQASPEASPHG
jgi:drug/metabolite transporter (DMT)-like permease